eukprot:7629794-Pyramimonas_sp.AAC.1
MPTAGRPMAPPRRPWQLARRTAGEVAWTSRPHPPPRPSPARSSPCPSRLCWEVACGAGASRADAAPIV